MGGKAGSGREGVRTGGEAGGREGRRKGGREGARLGWKGKSGREDARA